MTFHAKQESSQDLLQMKKQFINFSCIFYGIYLYLCIYFKRDGASHEQYTIIPPKIGGFDGDVIFHQC